MVFKTSEVLKGDTQHVGLTHQLKERDTEGWTRDEDTVVGYNADLFSGSLSSR
jgi:hypothetical protein